MQSICSSPVVSLQLQLSTSFSRFVLPSGNHKFVPKHKKRYDHGTSLSLVWVFSDFQVHMDPCRTCYGQIPEPCWQRFLLSKSEPWTKECDRKESPRWHHSNGWSTAESISVSLSLCLYVCLSVSLYTGYRTQSKANSFEDASGYQALSAMGSTRGSPEKSPLSTKFLGNWGF